MKTAFSIFLFLMLVPAAETSSDVHSVHVGSADCADCHISEGEKDGGWSGNGLVVLDHKTCLRCHYKFAGQGGPADVKEKKIMCDSCHAGKKSDTGKKLIFNHARHQKTDKKCQDCHEVKGSSIQLKDVMNSCVDCHTSKIRKEGCGVCHANSAGIKATSQTAGTGAALPSGMPGIGKLLPGSKFPAAAHDPSWGKTHGKFASPNVRLCRQCHDERMCEACHSGRNRSLPYHTGDWVAVHGLYSKKKKMDCTGCHSSESFCAGCHQRTGAAPLGAAKSSYRPHTAGWAGNGHMQEARKDITQCSSCHTEQSCLECHASQSMSGPGKSVHSGDIIDKCGTYLARNSNACLKCHTLDDVKTKCYGVVNQMQRKRR